MIPKVLVVDDEPSILSSCRRVLRSCFKVYTASNGLDALAIMNSEGPFSAIITDYAMPDMDGISLCVEARRLSPQTRRIILTGKGDLQVATDAINKGEISFFLNKPCIGNKLIKAILTAIESGSTQYSNVHSELQLSEGLIALYRGNKYLQEGSYSKAAEKLIAARELLSGRENPAALVRADLLLATTILAEPDAMPEPDNSNINIQMLIVDALAILNSEETALLKPQELTVVQPALEWAVQNKVFGSTATALINADQVRSPDLFKITLLGNLLIKWGNKVISDEAFSNPKAKLLFLYLLTRRYQHVDRDVLCGTFWPNLDQAAARNNLSSQVYLLRKLVGPDLIKYQKGFYSINTCICAIDVDTFTGLANLALSSGKQENRKHIGIYLNKAIELYQGDYLSEYLYIDWINEERTALRRRYTTLLATLAELMADDHDFEKAAATLEKAPILQEYDDQLLFKLIDYYIKSGNRGKALQRFDFYRQKIAEELDLEPDPKIASLLN